MWDAKVKADFAGDRLVGWLISVELYYRVMTSDGPFGPGDFGSFAVQPGGRLRIFGLPAIVAGGSEPSFALLTVPGWPKVTATWAYT